MAFVFRFQSLLEHRRRIEDERQRDLAKLLRSRMIFHDRLREMQQTIRDARQDLSEGLSGQVNLSSVGDFARYTLQTRASGQSIVHQLAELERHIDSAKERLNEAMRERKALELLEERDREAWEAEDRRREAMQMDELAMQMFERQRQDRQRRAARSQQRPAYAAGAGGVE